MSDSKGTEDFQKEAKKVADEFTSGAKEVFDGLSQGDSNKRVLAGVLGIIFGTIGLHKFILGYNKEGLIMLLVSILSFGFLAGLVGLIGLIEGIIYLTKSDAEFYQMYQVEKKPWF